MGCVRDGRGKHRTLRRLRRIDDETVELEPVNTNLGHEPIKIGSTTVDGGIDSIGAWTIVGTRRHDRNPAK